MNKNTLYVFLTRNGALFDRTSGKNERIMFNKEYQALNGFLIFTKETDGKVKIKRVSEERKPGYDKVLTEPGMYVLNPLYVQPLPKTSREVRILYNKIKDILSKPRFKIDEDDNFDDPLKIQFVARNEGGVIETKYLIRVNPDMLSTDDISIAVKIIERAEKVVEHDFRNFIGDKLIGNNEEIKIRIDDEYLDNNMS